MAEYFNRIAALASKVRKYRNDRAFCVIAERLIDFVTNCEFGSHGPESFDLQALRAVRFKCGFFAIGATRVPIAAL